VSGAVISGVGLCCSLGQTFADAAKAYAAGDVNFEKSDKVIGPDGMPQRLAPVFGFHDIHNYEARLQRLFQCAMDDLAAQTGLTPAPMPLRLIIPGWLKGNPIEAGFSEWLIAEYGGRLKSIDLISSENAMLPSDLARALLAVNEGEAPAMLVGAIDSFMHAELIDALALNSRLLCRTQPHGVIPSEAAALFRVCLPHLAAPEAPGGGIAAVWTGRETESIAEPKGILGRGLAKPFAAALAEREPHRLMIDLDGERWRSEELGFALAAAPPLPDDLAADFETPPLFTGFCGCATSGVMAALALAEGPIAPTPPADDPDGVEWTMISASQYNGLRTVALMGRKVAEEEQQEDAA
jgi:hypothetical protein